MKTALANWRRPGDPGYRLTAQRNAATLIIYVCRVCGEATCSRHNDNLLELGWMAEQPPKDATDFQRVRATCPKCAENRRRATSRKKATAKATS